MNINNTCTVSGAQTHLISSSSDENVIEHIKQIIYSWNYRSEYDLEAIKNDLAGIVDEVISQHFKDKIDTHIHKCVSCVVFNEIFDNLTPLLRARFSKEDLYLYEKCTFLCKQSISPGQFGSSLYNSLPFIAAVVELSVLDTYKSPLEKIACLCSTYDLIFAELKLALVSIISKYSERECEIPVINNDEVIPILMLVVIKSKLLYLWSNLFYIKYFGGDILEENDHIRSILQVYETAVEKITTLEESSLKSSCDNMPTNLDIAETMEIISAEETVSGSPITIKEERKKRLVSLIITSTAEKNFIPLDVAKIFS